MGRKKKNTEVVEGGGLLAIIYRRISTEVQKEGTGLDLQLRLCQGVCARNGFTVVDVLDDEDVSGSIPAEQREGLRKARAMCVDKQANIIIAYDQGRFARSASIDEEVRKHAKKYKYKLWSALDDIEITAEQNELTADARAFVMGLERKLIAGRFFKGRKEKAATDGYGSGPLAYGYKKVQTGVTQKGRVIWKVEIDDEKAKAVRLIIRMNLDGKTYNYIADHLNDAGIPAPYASRTRKEGTTYAGKWTSGKVYNIMQRLDLYTTGRKSWAKIEGIEAWPIILKLEG